MPRGHEGSNVKDFSHLFSWVDTALAETQDRVKSVIDRINAAPVVTPGTPTQPQSMLAARMAGRIDSAGTEARISRALRARGGMTPVDMGMVGTRGGPPPPDHRAMAERYGRQYGVDPNVLLAIASHETGYGSLGDGRFGNVLGYGSFDSGSSYKWAGMENQYRAAARTLHERGVHNIDELVNWSDPSGHMKNVYGASDAGWTAGVVANYRGVISQPKDVPAPQLPGGKAIPVERIPAKEFTPVGNGQTLHPEAATAFQRAQQELAKKGIVIQPISGYRSYEEQAHIHAQGGLSAEPGRSIHQAGLAVDIQVGGNLDPATVRATLAKYGFYQSPYIAAKDPNHFTYGTDDDHGVHYRMGLREQMVSQGVSPQTAGGLISAGASGISPAPPPPSKPLSQQKTGLGTGRVRPGW